MQRISLYLIGSMLLLLSGCSFQEGPFAVEAEPDTDFVPVLMDRDEMESSIGFVVSKEIETPGKLYTYGNYILLNDRYQGIHIIDNTDRQNPRKVGFFRIPGNLDMAVKAGKMYADNGTDLLVVDLLNPEAPELVHRGRDVFPELPPPDLRWVPGAFSAFSRPENTVIVGWEPLEE